MSGVGHRSVLATSGSRRFRSFIVRSGIERFVVHVAALEAWMIAKVCTTSPVAA